MSLIALVARRDDVVFKLLTSQMVSAQHARINNLCPKEHTQGLGKVQRRLSKPQAQESRNRVLGNSKAPSKNAWSYAKDFGEHLSWTDRPTATEIRVSQAKKKVIWEFYLKYFARDITNTAKPIDSVHAVHAWNAWKDLSHIKSAKYKEGFSEIRGLLTFWRWRCKAAFRKWTVCTRYRFLSLYWRGSNQSSEESPGLLQSYSG